MRALSRHAVVIVFIAAGVNPLFAAPRQENPEPKLH